MKTARPRLHAPEFFSFWPIASVVVLALNDHVLKARFHNALTGKLSDFAGCFVLPLFVSALLSVARVSPRRRVLVGIALTAGLMCTIKLSTTGAELVETMLVPFMRALGIATGAQIVADPTDLMGFVMFPVAYRFAQRAAGDSWG